MLGSLRTMQAYIDHTHSKFIMMQLEALKEGLQLRVHLGKYMDLGTDPQQRCKKDNKNGMLLSVLGTARNLQKVEESLSAYLTKTEITPTEIQDALEHGNLEVAILEVDVPSNFLKLVTEDDEVVDGIKVVKMAWTTELDNIIEEVDKHTCQYYTSEKSWKKDLPEDAPMESVMQAASQTLEKCKGATIKAILTQLMKARVFYCARTRNPLLYPSVHFISVCQFLKQCSQFYSIRQGLYIHDKTWLLFLMLNYAK